MRAVIRIAVCCAILGCLALLGQSPAAAHTDLVASSPAAGDRLAASPTQVVLEFDEPVVPQQSRLVVLDDQRRAYPSELLTSVTGTVLVAVLEPGAPAGAWTIAYDVLAADGHTRSGSIPFAVRSGLVTAPASSTAGWAVPALLLVFAVGLAAAVRAVPGSGARVGRPERPAEPARPRERVEP